ncbi:MAG: ribose 5-phosphate isomerase B [Thermodesulfobacteriota bacterium]
MLRYDYDTAIGADHAGFALKSEIKAFLKEGNWRVSDLGTHNTNPVDYPDIAWAVCAAILDGKADKGIVICGSGVGASIAANKLRGIRAGLCHDTYSAHQGVEHDNMNVLCLGSRIVGTALAMELAAVFLKARFSGGERHVRRLGKITAIEKTGRAPR